MYAINNVLLISQFTKAMYLQPLYRLYSFWIHRGYDYINVYLWSFFLNYKYFAIFLPTFSLSTISSNDSEFMTETKIRWISKGTIDTWRSPRPHGLKCRSAAARLLALRVWISSGAWISVSCHCCVLSGRGLCDGLVFRLEDSYRVWRVWVWSRNLNNEVA